MNTIEVGSYLSELSSDSPCGENLEYDPAFVALERDVQGKPETQYGDTVIAGEPPDWKAIKKSTLELAGRTRDLRVAAYLARALLKMDGVQGFCDALALLQGLIDQRWDAVHPQLDPDDGFDPTMRVNTIATLCDSSTVIRDLRETPLVSSRVHGRFSLRDIEVASGESPPASPDDKPDHAAIDAAFMEADVAELQATGSALEQSMKAVQAIEALVTDKVGASQAADLSALTRQLKKAHGVVAERLSRRGVAAAPEAGGEAAGADGAPSAAGAAVVQVVAGQIASRDDVVRMLDKICEYYLRHEPSSPVPLLLERAKKLVRMGFMDILQDLAPNGLDQMAVIRGKAEGE